MSRVPEPTRNLRPRASGFDSPFGVPMGDLGWFTSLLMGLASGVAAFFFATFCAIFTILILNASGRTINYTVSYRWVGLPAGVLVAVFALGYLGTLWVRRQLRRK